MFQSRKIDLYGKKERLTRQDANGTQIEEYYSFHFVLGNARLKCVLFFRLNSLQMTTSILREDAHEILPTGMGLAVYKKMIDSIQMLADREGKSILHIVNRYLAMSTTPLSIERWNELFLPLLSQKGREYDEDPDCPDTFSRTFEPRK